MTYLLSLLHMMMVSCPHFPSSHCDHVCDDWSPTDMFDVMMMAMVFISVMAWHQIISRARPLVSVTGQWIVTGLRSSPRLRVWSYWLMRQKIMYSRQDKQKWTPDTENQRWNRGGNFHPSGCRAQFISMARSPWDCDTSPHLGSGSLDPGCWS